MIKVNSAKGSGYLYYFVPNWNDLELVVTTGIQPSMYGEFVWDKSKKIDRKYDKTARFASTTRNPYALLDTAYKTSSGDWHYAVILDKNKLSDNVFMKPNNYFMRPDKYQLLVIFLTDGSYLGMKIDADSGEVTNQVKLSKSEFDELVTWGLENGSAEEGEKEDGEIFLPYESQYILEDMGITGEDIKQAFFIDFNLGESDIYQGYGDTYATHQLPKAVFKIRHQTYTESEERLYPKAGEEYINIKRAIVGILIPDISYFKGDERVRFENRHPDIPVYIYRPRVKDPEIDEYLRLNPEVKKLYRYPR